MRFSLTIAMWKGPLLRPKSIILEVNFLDCGKCYFVLILGINNDLVVPRKTIKEVVSLIAHFAFENMLNEWQGKVVAPSDSIDL